MRSCAEYLLTFLFLLPQKQLLVWRILYFKCRCKLRLADWSDSEQIKGFAKILKEHHF